MNKTNYFIECLELMGWTVKPSGLCPGEWLVYKVDSHEHLTAQQIEDKTRKELIKRDGVMERVFAFIATKQDWPFPGDRHGLEKAIKLGITPKELMGVEG